ncbi:hypothetical protein MKW98_012794 [Papaver atlanticum]|uniref:PGG domain-containing protein n=1 Tax=Papaver atlanticum TaxID=357466 RepID=A0AAD4XHD1_9MAGN|nr:hypothetical protein MKW98_012794 [Papaver atlanticum]
MDIIHDVTRRGDVESLRRILAANPDFPLADPKYTCFRQTPLHVAAIRNYVDFASEIMRFNPLLGNEKDSQGFTPLHLATSKNNVKMVSVLIDANPDACLVPDIDGRTPLHLAAMRNEIDIMDLLIDKRPEAIHQRILNTNETILHLCVKHNKFRAMKRLVEYLVDNKVDLANNPDAISVNSVDSGRNTIFHLAAQMKRMKMLKYLIKCDDIGIDINIRNNEEVKALHMLDRYEMDSLEIECYDYHNTSEVPQPNTSNEWLRERMNTIMIVAALIAGIAFQAVINPPGGVLQEDSKIDSVKDPVIAYYVNNLMSNTAMYPSFQPFYSPQETTKGNFINATDDEIINYRANFVTDLVTSIIRKSYTRSVLFPYISQDLAPGIVLDEDRWTDMWSNYNTTIGGGSGFSPYLIRYAGTAILAYASPNSYEAYIILNSLSLVVCGLAILVVTFDAIKQRPSGSTTSIVGYLEVLLATAVACISLSYTIVIKTIGPPFCVNGAIRNILFGLVGVVTCLPLATFVFLHIFSWFRPREYALGHPIVKLFIHTSNSRNHEFTWFRFMVKMILFYSALLVLFFALIFQK